MNISYPRSRFFTISKAIDPNIVATIACPINMQIIIKTLSDEL